MTLYNPSDRDKYYQGNVAQYLLDLHNEGATFDFCGGMIFQFVLTDKLIAHLEPIASLEHQQPIIHPVSQSLMSRISNYNKSSHADNRSIFHGREIRKVSNANGGMGFVLQLSCADDYHGDDNDEEEDLTITSTSTTSLTGGTSAIIQTTKSSTRDSTMLPKGANAIWNGQPVDPQGWSLSEITTYDGWRSDTFRQWRNARMYESEAEGGGYTNFSNEMGKDAYGLHHRFFLHYDDRGRMWLCAEDGCEGTPVNLEAKKRGLFGKLLGGMTMFGE